MSFFWPGCDLILVLVLVLVAAVRGAVFVLAIGVIGKRHVDAGKHCQTWQETSLLRFEA